MHYNRPTHVFLSEVKEKNPLSFNLTISVNGYVVVYMYVRMYVWP